MKPVQQLSKAEKQSLVRSEISRWFDRYHNALLELQARAKSQNIPFSVHIFTKSQGERFTNFESSSPKAKPRLKCLTFLTAYHLNEIELLIEHYHQQALQIIERFELPKHPKLLEKPAIIQHVIAANFTKNPAISILKIEPDDAIEWFNHQIKMIHDNVPQPLDHPVVSNELYLLEQAIEQIKQFQSENDGSKVLKRFYQSGFSYRATLRFANHTQQVISLNEFLFIVGQHHEHLPAYGDSTQLPYSRKKRADKISKSDRNIVAQTPNESHYYFWEYQTDKTV